MVSDLDRFCRTEYGCDGKQSLLCDIYVLTAEDIYVLTAEDFFFLLGFDIGLRSSVFWYVTLRRSIIIYRRLGTNYHSHLQYCLTLEDGKNSLSRNVED